MTIALCYIATGKYSQFVDVAVSSARRFFCPELEPAIFLFTDNPGVSVGAQYTYRIKHEPWPGPTLHRYRTMLLSEALLARFDHVFYSDVDMRFEGPVGDEICPNAGLTATLHPGYEKTPASALPYDGNPKSKAFVRPGEGRRYFCGGFQGGRSESFIVAMHRMSQAIDSDAENGVTARWHDESHWNRHLIYHPPNVILSPLYCSPDPWHVPGRKIVCLEKNHREMRCMS